VNRFDRWIHAWCELADGIIGILTFGSKLSRLKLGYKHISYVMRKEKTKTGE